MVTVRTWCRVDLAGGTLDLWPIGLLHPGARTVNLAVDLAATVRLQGGHGEYVVIQGESEIRANSAAELRAHPEGALVGVVAEALGLPPVTVELSSDSPRGGGLGGSSALAVALITAAEVELGLPSTGAAERVHLARDLEARLMSLPTGVQDHYPALLGGALEILQLPGGERVRRLEVDLDTLGESLLVVYSGASHFSAGNNWQVIRRRLDGEPEVMALFQGIADVAAELVPALEGGDFRRTGELMSLEWSHRRRLAEGISTPLLESLIETAMSLGAWGGKACGAGGGGCLAFLCPPERREAIAGGLQQLGGEVLPARPTAAPILVSTS